MPIVVPCVRKAAHESPRLWRTPNGRFGSKAVLPPTKKIHSPQYGTEKRPTSLPQACRYPSSDVRPESNHTGAPAYISCNNSLINARYGESSLRRWIRITGEVARSEEHTSELQSLLRSSY